MNTFHARLRRSTVIPLAVLTLLLGATALATPATSAPPPSPAALAAADAAFELRPGVVVDPTLGSLYRMRPQGGLDALALRDGASRWSSEEADVPLLVFGDWLLALRDPEVPRGTMTLVAFDRQSGSTVFTTTAALPEGTWAGVDDGLGKRFTVQAWHDGAVARFAWTSSTRRIGGMRDSTTEPVVRSGVFALDLAAESLVTTSDAPPVARRPDLPPEARLAGLDDLQFLAMDDGHVMTSVRFADDRTFDKYRWSVTSRANGDRVGTFDTFASYAPFGVVGQRVVHELPPHGRRIAGEMVDLPLSVQVVDLRTGRALWSEAVRDTGYHGPFPP